MSNICEFDKILPDILPETAELRIWINLKEIRQTGMSGEQDI